MHDITPRTGGVSLVSQAGGATATPTGDASRNELLVTAADANLTIAAPSGTAAQGNVLIIRVKDNGTSRTLTWNAIYRFFTTKPAGTTVNKTAYYGVRYNATDTRWDVIAYAVEP